MSSGTILVPSPELAAAREAQVNSHEKLMALRDALTKQQQARHNLLLAGPNSGLLMTDRRLTALIETNTAARFAMQDFALADQATTQTLASLTSVAPHRWYQEQPGEPQDAAVS